MLDSLFVIYTFPLEAFSSYANKI